MYKKTEDYEGILQPSPYMLPLALRVSPPRSRRQCGLPPARPPHPSPGGAQPAALSPLVSSEQGLRRHRQAIVFHGPL